ncbi:MAG: IS110 family transposase, partial [Colwellia sp.]|nr:IS110 family transposase [Colwellia sp.]
QLPMPMRHSISKMWALYSRLEDDFKTLNNELMHLTEQDDDCKKLMKLEGVGPITSMRLKIQLGCGEHFKSSRQVSACIGLKKSDHDMNCLTIKFHIVKAIKSTELNNYYSISNATAQLQH